jgi:hypothetical protein
MRRTLADLFTASLVLYLILFLLENVFPGFVSKEFSLNYLLIPVMFFGVASSAFPLPERESIVEEKVKKSDIWMSVVLSIVGGGLIYYKIELEATLRIAISLLSGLLILIMSLLVIFPENYEWKKPAMPQLPKLRLRPRHLWYLLIVLQIAVLVWILKSPIADSTTVVRLAPEKYKIVLINRSGKPAYTDSYKKLLVNDGYTNVKIDSGVGYPETATAATIMYFPEDKAAGDEIADVLGKTYGAVQLAPPVKNGLHTIVVIIK